jgi:hypothetical protein
MTTIIDNIELDETNEEFKYASEFVSQTDKTVYLTGKAGTGKTTFLKYLRKTTSKNTVILAPTGVAAINAGGQTINSFFQLPFGPFVSNDKRLRTSKEIDDIDNTTIYSTFKYREDKKHIIEQLDLLIIDEISMVRCDTLDVIDRVLRVFRKKPHLPFGGVQVILIGDTFQLPPIVKFEQWEILNNHYESPFFFSSKIFTENKPVYIEFKKIYRQKEQEFIDLLNKIRTNQINESELNQLNKKYNPTFSSGESDNHIILSTTNNEVNLTNATKLVKLSTALKIFQGQLIGVFPKDSKGDFVLPTEQNLQLKIGAQVMILKNDTGENKRYFNGKIGKIESLEENRIIVQFADESKVQIEKTSWDNIQYTWNNETHRIEEIIVGTFTQYPVRLAWAITVHKSQGLTFENVYADLGSAFEDGQVYVALSRCTSLNGLVLKSIIPRAKISTNKKVLEFAKTETPHTLIVEELNSGKADFYYRKVREELKSLNFNQAYEFFTKALKFRNDIDSEAFKKYFIVTACKFASYKLKHEKLYQDFEKNREENEDYNTSILGLKIENKDLRTKIEEQKKIIKLSQDIENESNGEIKELKNKINQLTIIDSKYNSEVNRNLVIEIFERNPQFFINLISKYYPLNIDLIEGYHERYDWWEVSTNKNVAWSIKLIEKYKHKLHGYTLSLNESLPWSIELLEKLEDNWDWGHLSMSNSLPWSIELINKFKNKWEKHYLSRNESLPWSLELIGEYKGAWDWEHLSGIKDLNWSTELLQKNDSFLNWKYLSWNESLPWSKEFIEKYNDKWDWDFLSRNKYLPWSIELIKQFEDHWDWISLSSNESLPWSIVLIEQFEDKWSWKYGLSSNKSLTWSIDLLKKFEDHWVWHSLSRNESIPWSIEFIEKFSDNWKWQTLSSNKSLPWSLELLEKFQDYWDWYALYENESVPWSIALIDTFKTKWSWYHIYKNQISPLSIELIEEYEDKWDWKELSRNESLLWSIELVEKYENKWDWYSLSINESLPWSLELLERYKNKWDWKNLSNNKSLPWSIELLEKHEDKWDWYDLSYYTFKFLPWSIELVENFKVNWYWDKLSNNKSIPWSIELIEKFEDKWVWYNLSSNESLPWSLELLEKYEDKWNWKNLYLNQSLPWAIDFYEKYRNEIDFYDTKTESLPWYMTQIRSSKDKWQVETLSSKINLPWTVKLMHQFAEKLEASESIFEILKPFIDSEMINIVFGLIDKKQ